MNFQKKLTLVAILMSVICYADVPSYVIRTDPQKKYITISQNFVDPWGYEDEACITREGHDIACGLIKFSDPDSAILLINHRVQKVDKKQEAVGEKTFIELNLTYEVPRENDTVRLVVKNPKIALRSTLREIATNNPFNTEPLPVSQPEAESTEKSKIEEMRKLKSKIYWDDDIDPVSAISLGIDYAWPFVEYTQSVTNTSAMTIRAVKMNYPVSDGFLDGIGGFITYNYYPQRPLRGVWFQLGTGVYSMNVERGKSTGATWTASLISTAGYRLVWKETLSFGFAGGVEYLPNINMGTVKLDFSGFLPSFMLSAGYFF